MPRREPVPEPTRLPLAVRLGQLARTLPDLRGRDRLSSLLLRPGLRIDATLRGCFGGGLRFEGNPARDSNVLELVALRFCHPALAPVLDAALAPGDLFADVGANLGLYTLWGARRVGARGRVDAFEPVPEVRACLARNVELNGFATARIVAAGVGAESGRLVLYQHPGASGLTSRYLGEQAHAIEVAVTTLDAEYPRDTRGPALVKIDVEGMELEVLRGARELLASARAPIVVFEANALYLGSPAHGYADLLAFLDAAGGYRVFALRPSGLREEPRDAARPGSLNVLAARPAAAAHAEVLERLARVSFARNMNG